ncbi:MAG: choice-of-anchor D domain-containing protein [Myxococcales bacterium]|nr:choice-of-anchor D domain-containing protein [Myxococcales bacterium]
MKKSLLRHFGREWTLLALCGLAVAAVACDDIRAEQFPEALINPDPPVFVFPRVPVGEQVDRIVTIENIGEADLLLANIAFQGVPEALQSDLRLYWTLTTLEVQNQRVGIEDGTSEFPSPLVVAPGAQLSFILNFRPEIADEIPAGRLVMEANDPHLRTLEIPIIGTENSGELRVEPRSINFERVAAGGRVERTVTATNTGGAVVTISRLQLDGGAGDFTVVLNDDDPIANPALLEDPDQDGVAGLAPGRSFDVIVIYQPDGDGQDVGALTYHSDAVVPQVTVNLLANGATPCIRVNPNPVQYGAVLIGRDHPERVEIESCGGEPLTINDIRLVDDGGGAFVLDEDSLPPRPSQLPAYTDADREAGNAPPSRGISVLFNPADELAYGGMLAIDSDDPLSPTIEVPLVGRGTRNECPVARVAMEEFAVLPLDVITLDGSDSMDADSVGGRPEAYEWTVVSAPEGSVAQPVESFFSPLRPADGGPADNPATPTAQFFVDIAGEYVIELRVRDDFGLVAPSEECPQDAAQVHIFAQPDGDIHVQMVWDTPRDPNQTDPDGSDVDLFLLHPSARSWRDIPQRCYYANPSPDWGALGQIDDNPTLDIDDTSGAGPENINLNNPENTQVLGNPYRVGAHYYREQFGSSLVTIRIYLGGLLAWEGHQELIDTDDFWEAAAIVWTPGDRRVQAIDQFYQDIP